ncbi:hypothetical protein SmJEL517_g04259 [Synchytrium microbalum]|uniref:Carboxypeptidase n=1 Tax=Synchytrium microbalum TaxID=1806994 RepID=A0A507BV16_9FUNG|nr:uncharacterized protein SmJEL517_g04259 [Synchytrium microbalum]TPX32757.1 hypothetical protein SmJEL517_g04259 [Synchytrium microbalum]
MHKLLIALLALFAGATAASHQQQPILLQNDQQHENDLEFKYSRLPQVDAWTVLTNSKFPTYSVRVRERKGEICDDVKQYYGYLDVDESGGKHLFFWFFESRSNPKKDPLVLWLNGGPGCSSLTGLFMELGPCRVNEGGNGTTKNPYSWNKKTNIFFLDQPVNTGYSYTDGDGKEVDTSIAAAVDVYAFLQLFLQKYSQYAKLDFHLFGESYGGHYVPAIAELIDQNNDGAEVPINLKTLGIGNGLTDPLVQYKYYADMACDDKYGKSLTDEECDTMRSKYGTCSSLIKPCYQFQNAFFCAPGALYCNQAMLSPFQQSGRNVYDVRMTCSALDCYPILKDIEAFCNRPDIQDMLGVPERQYVGCNQNVNLRFLTAGDWMRPYQRALPPLLEKGIKLVVYAGDADYICNWIGNKAWMMELEWSGQEEFNAASDLPWTSSLTQKETGEYRTFGPLTWLKIYEAGHLVPYDQPAAASDFFESWIEASRD